MYISIRVRTLLLGLVAVAILAQFAVGQTKMARSAKSDTPILQAAVTPIVFDGQNIMCSDLNASTDPRFAYIISDNELKLNLTDPNGNYEFVNGTNTVVVGPEHPGYFVTISSGNATIYSWSSPFPITAVIEKVGSTSYVYAYDPALFSDTNLATGDSRGISHVSFCYQFAPTAAPVSLSGRVLDSSGNGISRVSIHVQDATTGLITYASTSTFGYYKVNGLVAGRTYIISATNKRYTFVQSAMVVSLLDDAEGINFIANPY